MSTMDETCPLAVWPNTRSKGIGKHDPETSNGNNYISSCSTDWALLTGTVGLTHLDVCTQIYTCISRK